MDRYERQRLYTIFATILLLLAAGLGWFFWDKSKTYLEEKNRTAVMLDSLSKVKMQLEGEVDSLAFAYDRLHSENENLQGMLASATSNLKAKESAIQAIKAQSSTDIASLKVQIDGLLKAKTEYETVIGLLQQENESLKNENTALKGKNQELSTENMQLSNEVSDLAKKLEDQIRKTQSAAFKASSFRVEVEKRNDHLTTRAKRVREIAVSFDLADVPELYRGQQKLYLAITDENGKAILDAANTNVSIEAPLQKLNITAQASKLVVLDQTQRINFNYILDEKLAKGNYVIAIYCDKGLLGATSIRLR